MILQKFQLIYILLPALLVFWGLVWFYFKKSHSYIKEYWFLSTSLSSRASHFFLILSFVFLVVALLDLRGEEEKISAKVPDQKTIILIDSSASMLSEDVRPNRFLKSLQIARHFVKNSAANQFSVFIFSDTFQRILPFTDDIDLVDSRLAALESLATVKGSSNIGYTIKGMIPYFQSEESDVAPVGNILVLTDGEDHEKNEKITLPEGVSLAVIGVGTQKGGQIPLRWNDGSFKGFKLSGGAPVVTKLNENYIKSLGKDVADYNYWIVNSFNLPTQEVAEFFKAKFTTGGKVGEVRSRKAYGEYPIALFVVSYILSLVFSQFKTFRVTAAVFALFFCLNVTNLRAEEERKISDETLKSLEKIRDGEANKSEILKTAEKLLAEGFPETAKKLYEEHRAENESVEVENNYAASLVQSKNTSAGIELFKKLLERKNLTEEQAQAVRKNLLTAIQKQKSDQNSKNQNDQNNSQQENQQQGNKSQSGNDSKDGKGQEEGQEQSKDNQKGQQDKQDKSSQNNSNGKQGKGSKEERDLRDLMNKKNQEKGDGGKEKNDKKDKKESNGKPEQDKEKEKNNQPKDNGEEPESFEDREKRLKQQKRLKKTPAILKQTLDLDRELQKKFLDASKEKSDNDPADSRPSKDW